MSENRDALEEQQMQANIVATNAGAQLAQAHARLMTAQAEALEIKNKKSKT